MILTDGIETAFCKSSEASVGTRCSANVPHSGSSRGFACNGLLQGRCVNYAARSRGRRSTVPDTAPGQCDWTEDDGASIPIRSPSSHMPTRTSEPGCKRPSTDARWRWFARRESPSQAGPWIGMGSTAERDAAGTTDNLGQAWQRLGSFTAIAADAQNEHDPYPNIPRKIQVILSQSRLRIMGQRRKSRSFRLGPAPPSGGRQQAEPPKFRKSGWRPYRARAGIVRGRQHHSRQAQRRAVPASSSRSSSASTWLPRSARCPSNPE